MFYMNKMKLTKKQNIILEKACKRSSPMIVRKQLLSAFGAQDDYDELPGLESINEPQNTPIGFRHSVGTQTYNVNNDEIRADIKRIVDEELNKVNDTIQAVTITQGKEREAFSRGLGAQKTDIRNLRKMINERASRSDLNQKFKQIMAKLRKMEEVKNVLYK